MLFSILNNSYLTLPEVSVIRIDIGFFTIMSSTFNFILREKGFGKAEILSPSNVLDNTKSVLVKVTGLDNVQTP